jgi:uncharacterized repeat protein (TIGR03809 family)
MTHRLDVAGGRDTVTRWCAFAEQRLEYLTELFETGRWRRFHSEIAFLENIQEAKTAVETWRGLATREASRNNSAAGIAWMARAAVPPRRDLSTFTEADRVSPEEVPSAPAIDSALELAPSLEAIEERYPLLRNAL